MRRYRGHYKYQLGLEMLSQTYKNKVQVAVIQNWALWVYRVSILIPFFDTSSDD